MEDSVPETCVFFVDDSNLWIEAQKAAASGSTNLNTPELDIGQDPRVRINAGKLVQTICRNRLQGDSFYYGSRPPPNDNVWKAFEKYNFATSVYDRNSKGKEKQVDSSMSAEIARVATRLEVRAEFSEKHRKTKDATTFVCITGDVDLKPPILMALDVGIRVELWAWESGISTEYLKLKGEHGLFSANYINRIMNEITYTNYRSTRQVGDGSGNKSKYVEPGKTVVLLELDLAKWPAAAAAAAAARARAKPKATARGTRPSLQLSATEKREIGRRHLDDALGRDLLCLGKLFFFTWSAHDGDTPPESLGPLFVEFPNVEHIEASLLQVRKELKDKATVVSWPEYASKNKMDSMRTEKTGSLFSPYSPNNGVREDRGGASVGRGPPNAQTRGLSAQAQASVWALAQHPEHPTRPEGDLGGADAATPADVGGWGTVMRHNPKKEHERGVRKSQRCRYGIRCGKRGECGYFHENIERKLFHDKPHVNFRMWKTSPCRSEPCRERKERCGYAHSQSEAWCPQCHHEGHFLANCEHKRSNFGGRGAGDAGSHRSG